MMGGVREAILQRLQPQQRDLVDRLRAQVKDQGLEEVLRRFARDNKEQIHEDELLIGISKLNANVHIQDIKELTRILKEGNSEGKISIADTVQLIGQ